MESPLHRNDMEYLLTDGNRAAEEWFPRRQSLLQWRIQMKQNEESAAEPRTGLDDYHSVAQQMNTLISNKMKSPLIVECKRIFIKYSRGLGDNSPLENPEMVSMPDIIFRRMSQLRQMDFLSLKPFYS
jgi:hypothetical protein